MRTVARAVISVLVTAVRIAAAIAIIFAVASLFGRFERIECGGEQVRERPPKPRDFA